MFLYVETYWMDIYTNVKVARKRYKTQIINDLRENY